MFLHKFTFFMHVQVSIPAHVSVYVGNFPASRYFFLHQYAGNTIAHIYFLPAHTHCGNIFPTHIYFFLHVYKHACTNVFLLMNSQMVVVPSTPVGGSLCPHVFQHSFSYLCFPLSPHLYVHYWVSGSEPTQSFCWSKFIYIYICMSSGDEAFLVPVGPHTTDKRIASSITSGYLDGERAEPRYVLDI